MAGEPVRRCIKGDEQDPLRDDAPSRVREGHGEVQGPAELREGEAAHPRPHGSHKERHRAAGTGPGQGAGRHDDLQVKAFFRLTK